MPGRRAAIQTRPFPSLKLCRASALEAGLSLHFFLSSFHKSINKTSNQGGHFLDPKIVASRGSLKGNGFVNLLLSNNNIIGLVGFRFDPMKRPGHGEAAARAGSF
jgi:hypothetical protein